MEEISDIPAYRVLARKYRPSSFEELIGQDALVRTLSNAIETGRIAHAFMLTGVRGVGKTTTARIIARSLNCIGPDGLDGPAVKPCGQCDNCISIRDDRHVDVIEMDAASRTGVDDVRELIEGVRYRPVSARYKVYIIDEVHMLSRNAFNALLKTLEEPPEHVKFIFATTEIRKVPVTVLSRCQRFDLRRVELDRLAEHFRWVASEEGFTVDDEALQLIARAADGSVRDGLSLLDQALVPGAHTLDSNIVRAMLGLADRAQVYDLFNQIMAGDISGGLDRFDTMYRDGADPLAVLQDILDLLYWLTRIKTAPAVAEAPYTPELERTHGKEMASKLSMSTLTRAWQLMLKGVGEVQSAPNAMQAAQMILVRLAHAADLPSPAALVRQLTEKSVLEGDAPSSDFGAQSQSVSDEPPVSGEPQPPEGRLTAGTSAMALVSPVLAELHSACTEAPLPESDPPLPQPSSFKEVVELFRDRREMILYSHLHNSVHLVRFELGHIELRPSSDAPRDLVNRVSAMLSEWTGYRWVVAVSGELGDETLAEQARAQHRRLIDEADNDEFVRAVKGVFPGAAVIKVTNREPVEIPDAMPVGYSENGEGDED
ncbi:MAG: DNA polymerase III subunit gamma/tau [Pseudomonadota bacterium]|nr:DNA polymerase III subunit gamma/tau [Pseudomonadota bacterium]